MRWALRRRVGLRAEKLLRAENEFLRIWVEASMAAQGEQSLWPGVHSGAPSECLPQPLFHLGETHCLLSLLSRKYESGLWIRCSRRVHGWPALLSTAYIYCHDFTLMKSQFPPHPKKKKQKKNHCSRGVGIMHLLLWQLYLPRHPQSQERWDAPQNKSFWSVIIFGVGAGARAVVSGSINLLDKYQSPKSSHRCGCKCGCMNRWLLLLSAGGTWEV